jgi:hypothetical protein
VVDAAEPARSLISVFWIRATTFSFKWLLIYAHKAEWTPFQTHCYSENLVTPGIEPGIPVYAARNSDHQTTRHLNDSQLRVKWALQSVF